MENLKLNLFEAYYQARKNKRNTYNQLRFEIHYETELFQLYTEIKNKTYKVGRSISFIVNNPVKREIFAAGFRDRVVHHLIFNYINPILDPQFIQDTYSCRKGKGTLCGIRKASRYLKDVSNNFTQNAYVLKLDIRGYFMNINREKLMQKLKKMVPEEVFSAHQLKATKDNPTVDIDYSILCYLLEQVVFNNPTENCIIKSEQSEWEGLPNSKSLFKSKPNCGLPIGNLTSQLFSNVYLSDFDHYVKDVLEVKYYGRYVDDFFIFSESVDELKILKKHLSEYLFDTFSLTLHPNKVYLQHYSKGLAFLGAYIKPHRIYVGNRTKANFKQLISFVVPSLMNQAQKSKSMVKNVVAMVNSYLGLMWHYQTYSLRYKILTSASAVGLYKLGYFNSGFKKMTLLKKWK